MHVLVTTSANYQPVFNIFQDSIKHSSVELHIVNLDLSQYTDISFQSDGWYDALRQKIKYVIEFMKYNRDIEYFIVSDADIQYFSPGRLRELLVSARDRELDFYGMRESGWETYNGGFYVISNNDKCRNLLEEVATELMHQKPAFGDQTLINDILFNGNKYKIRHDFIPAELYLWGDGCPTQTAIFHHAVCTSTVDDKIRQLRAVRERYNNKCWLKPEKFQTANTLHSEAYTAFSPARYIVYFGLLLLFVSSFLYIVRLTSKWSKGTSIAWFTF